MQPNLCLLPIGRTHCISIKGWYLFLRTGVVQGALFNVWNRVKEDEFEVVNSSSKAKLVDLQAEKSLFLENWMPLFAFISIVPKFLVYNLC